MPRAWALIQEYASQSPNSTENPEGMYVKEEGRRDEERVNHRPAIFQGLVDYSKDWLLL